MSRSRKSTNQAHLRFFRNGFSNASDIEIFGDGEVLDAALVNLIFWGSFWTGSSANPSRHIITKDVRKILSSSFMRDLKQYNIKSKASFHKEFVFQDTEPRNGFADKDVTKLIRDKVGDGELPNPDAGDRPFVHCVVMPEGILSKSRSTIGFHFSTPYKSSEKKLNIVWILFGTRSVISEVFSHELVETCTNPNGKGIRLKSSFRQLAGDEIADICMGRVGRLKNGVCVQSYWSQEQRSCIIPT